MYILEDLILPKNLKIKAIRKYLKVNQQDLAGNKIDRSLISYIENGKTKLTTSTASIIASNLSKIIRQKKLDFNVSGEYIFADEARQVEFLLDSYIDKLIKLKKSNYEGFKSELEKIENILNEWDIASKKARVFEIAADYYYEKSFNEESKIYYLKSLENYSRLSDYNNMASINSKIARCALRKNNYEESIYINTHVLYMIESNNICDPVLEKRVLFNSALANIKINNCDYGIMLLDKLKEKLSEEDKAMFLEILILQGNTYVQNNEYYKALEVFEHILEISDSTDNREAKAMAYNNIAYVYGGLKQIDKSILYYTKSLRIREEINSKFVLSSLISLAEKCFENKDNDLGRKYLSRAIEILNSNTILDIKCKTYENLLNIYMRIDFIKLDENIYDNIIKLIKQSNRDVDVQELIIKLCGYYIDKDIEKVKYILKLSDKK